MTNNYCKNECYNYKLCKALGNVPNDLEVFESCNFAISKSRIIELPCKVGDEIYYISYSPLSYELLKAKVIDFCINRNGIYAVELKTIKSDYIFTLDIRKVYFDKSKAEAKLKEMEE